MDTELLKIFLIVVEEGSISAAAERLHFSQPAASKRLRSLEESVGEELFLRHNRGVELTEAGQRVAGYARRIVQLEDSLRLDLEALRSPAPETIELVTTQFISTGILPCLLWSFRQQQENQHIDVQVTTTSSDRALQLVVENVAPLALVDGPVHDDALEMKVLGSEPLVLVGTPELAAKTGRQEETVPVLLPERGTGVRRAFAAACEGALLGGVGSPRQEEAFHNLDSLRLAAVSGLGRVLIPRIMVQRDLLEGTLVLCPGVQKNPVCELPYGFVWRRERRLGHAYQLVIEHSARCTVPIPIGKAR